MPKKSRFCPLRTKHVSGAIMYYKSGIMRSWLHVCAQLLFARISDK
jgi:hypothetical protein